MRHRCLVASLVAVVLTLAGCGSSSSSNSSSSSGSGPSSSSSTNAGGSSSGIPDLTVSAAASLKAAFTAYGAKFTLAHARFSFAGSDMLATADRAGGQAGRVRLREHDAAEAALRERAPRAAGDVRGEQARARRARILQDHEHRRCREVGHNDRDRLGDGSDRDLHAQGARQARSRPEQADPRQRALRGARRERGHRQAHRGRRRRRLRRTSPTCRRLTASSRRSRCRRVCSPSSPTASPSSRARRIPCRRSSSSPACCTATAAPTLLAAGFLAPPHP